MNILNKINCDSEEKNVNHVVGAHSLIKKSVKELVESAFRVCSAIEEMEAKKGDRILILMSNRLEMIEIMLAAFNLGAVAVPVDPKLGANQIAEIIERVKPGYCFIDSKVKHEYQGLLLKYCKAVVAVKARSNIDSEMNTYLYADLLAGNSVVKEIYEHDESDPAVIIHSSGSTGTPKAVYRSHGALNNFIEYFFQYHNVIKNPEFSMKPQILTLPLSHMGGLFNCLCTLSANRPLYLMSYFLTDVYLQLVNELKPDAILLVPSMYSMLLRDDPLLDKVDFSSIRICNIGAEACPESVFEKIKKKFNALPVSTYAATEFSSGLGFTLEEKREWKVPNGSCGRHLFGDIKLVASDGVESDEYGELYVNNGTVEKCYMDKEMNEKKFDGDWYKTGDLFYRDSEGYFYWRGRVDDMFVCKGNNLYPTDIENILNKYPSIRSACACPIKDGLDNTIVAVLIAKASDDISESEVIRILAKEGPSFAVPSLVHFVDEMPMIGIGKLDRKTSRKLLQKEYDSRNYGDVCTARAS